MPFERESFPIIKKIARVQILFEGLHSLRTVCFQLKLTAIMSYYSIDIYGCHGVRKKRRY